MRQINNKKLQLLYQIGVNLLVLILWKMLTGAFGILVKDMKKEII